MYQRELPHKALSLIQLVKANKLNLISEMMRNSDPIEMTGKILQNDSCGWTSLHHASHLGYLEVLKLLLSKMSQRDALEAVSRVTWIQQTCLAVACTSKTYNIDVVHYLLSLGSDPNTKDARKWTPMFAACQQKGNLEIFKLLLTMGAELMPIPFCTKFTYLDYAITRKDADLFHYLLRFFERKDGFVIKFYSYPLALQSMPELVPIVLKFMGIDGIKDLISDKEKLKVCRLYKQTIADAREVDEHFSNTLEMQTFLIKRFGLMCEFTGDNPDLAFMTSSVRSNYQHNTPCKREDCRCIMEDQFYQPMGEFATELCWALSSARIQLKVDDTEDFKCDSKFFRAFPELDVRQKISLKAKARHVFRCELNKKYGNWRAYKWLKDDFSCPGLKNYIFYENEPDIVSREDCI